MLLADTRCIECKGYDTRTYLVAVIEKVGDDKTTYSDHAYICDGCIDKVRKDNPGKQYDLLPSVEFQLPDEEIFEKIERILKEVDEYKEKIKTTNDDGKSFHARVLHGKIREIINTYESMVLF